ncbi:MAG: TonB-dependent receptor [Bacteroidia bacterium]|nr:TonB-dependent receptor [Bacteroidia bacterium]
MKKIFTFIFSFLSIITLAQKITVKGIVSDKKTKETLVGATISVSKTTIGVATDLDGKYTIELDPGNYTLVCRSVGYKGQEIKIDLKEPTTLDFTLDLEDAILNTVVVSAGKFEQKVSELTVSMEVIKPKLIESKNTTNIQQIIEQTPGVSVIGGQPNIRGGSGFSYGAGSRVLIMVDDLPLLAPDAQDAKWDAIPTENIEQIEIIKGASSALFGSSALNGVINVRTAYPKAEPITKVTTFTSIYDNIPDKKQIWWKNGNPIITGTNFFHSRQIKNFDLTVGGSSITDEGYRELEKEQRSRFNFSTRYRFKKIEGLSVGINGNLQHNTGGLFLIWQNADSGAYRPAGGVVSNYHTYRTNIDPFIVYNNSKIGKFSLRTRFYRTNNTNDTKQGSLADMYYGDLQYQKQFENKLTITAGTVYNQTYVTAQLYGKHNGENKAAYLQLDKKLWNKLNISFGLRGEYYRIDTVQTRSDIYFLKPQLRKQFIDSTGLDTLLLGKKSSIKPLLRFGVSYELTKATFLRASIGQGYRFPSIAERYIRTSASGVIIYPNDSVQPETGWNTEFGVKQGFKISNWNGFIDVAAFWTEYQNMIQFQLGQWGNPAKDPMYGVGFAAKNIGYARIKGFDGSIVGNGKIGNVETTVLAGYTYIVPTNLTYWNDTSYVNDPFRLEARLKNNDLKYRSRHLAKADVQADYKKLMLGASIRYNSYIRNIDPLFEDTTIKLMPGLWYYRRKHITGDYVVDARIGYQVNHTLKVSFMVNNVLNRMYMLRPGDMQPPRLFQVQFLLTI